MRFDKLYYRLKINFIDHTFNNIFKNDIKGQETVADFNHMGYFRIKYLYIPLGYELLFENDRNNFVIDISDHEGAKTSLYRIIKFANILTNKNIKTAILLLKDVLDRGHINFYIYKNHKVYKKLDGKYKRVNNWYELK